MLICFIDVETTGLDPYKNGLIQISGIIEINGGANEKFDYKVKPFPEDEISDKALAVSGHTREQIESFEAPTIIHDRFTTLLGKYVDKFNPNDKFFFAGYNALFDDGMMRAWFKKCGDNYFGSWFWWPCIDVAVLAAQHLLDQRASMPNFQLKTVASKLGIIIDEERLHDAFYDILLTTQIYDAITKQSAT